MGKRVIILGGGVSGLTTAWSLGRASSRLNVTLLEGTHRTGGWVHSDRLDNGAVHELGPRSMRVAQKAGKIALAMLSELGLESEVIPISRGHKAAQRRLIYTDQYKLVELPSSISWLFKTKPPFSKPLLSSLVSEPFVKTNRTDVETDESIHNFIKRRFGSEIAEWLINPMCRGVFASSSHHLSIRSCFPLLYNYEQQYGSILRGMVSAKPEHSGVEDNKLVKRSKKEKWMIYTLKNGLQTLTDTLTTAAETVGVDIFTNTIVTGVIFENKYVKVVTTNGEYIADYVISTIPAKALAKGLSDAHSQLSSTLDSIPSVNVGVVNLEYDGKVIPEQWREAFGYLVPSHQHSSILGTVFDSSTFPELDRKDRLSTRLTVMMGGEWFEELFGDPNTVNDDTLVNTALQSLYTQLEISQEPSDCHVTVQKNCIPQYTLGHQLKIDAIESYMKSHGLPLSLLGSSYHGISVNDCIMHSLLEARNVLSHLDEAIEMSY